MSNKLSLHVSSEGSYTPSYKPFKKTLLLTYNGAAVRIKVTGLEIHACVTTIEGNFCLSLTQKEVIGLSWGEIVKEVLGAVIARMTATAMCQREFLEQEEKDKGKEYYVQ